MSLVPLTLDLLHRKLKAMTDSSCASKRILSLGYPDILANVGQVEGIFGKEVVSKLEYRDDAAKVLRWHNATNVTSQLIETRSLFRAIGFEMDVLDLAEIRGGEIIQDLNEPMPESMNLKYAAVLDAGTLEHCFNIAQAVKNVSSAVAVGGFIMHGNPLNMYNHGFYNLNPTWYGDFYGANGFTVDQIQIVLDSVSVAPRVANAPLYQRFNNIPDGAVLLVVATRKEATPVTWPIQYKYRMNPGLAG